MAPKKKNVAFMIHRALEGYGEPWKAAILCCVMSHSPNKIYINRITYELLFIVFQPCLHFIECSVENS